MKKTCSKWFPCRQFRLTSYRRGATRARPCLSNRTTSLLGPACNQKQPSCGATPYPGPAPCMPIRWSMTSHGVQTVKAEPAASRPEWLWAWNGVCFGYRFGDSLFTHDGVEVGRFFGAEVYGIHGQYLGEVSPASDGHRLITNSYKKSRSVPAFVPTLHRFYKRPPNRAGEPLYCGHENFPSPEIVRAIVFPA